MNNRLTNEEKYEILFMYNVQGIPPYRIHKMTGRSRPTVQRVIDEEQHIFDDIPIEERIKESILKSYEKYSIDVGETVGTINRVLRDQVERIASKEYLTPTDIKVLIDIDKRLRSHQVKSLENSERINYNKRNLDIKEKEINKDDDSTKEFMEGFTNMIKEIKDDGSE
jgi:hypothetical protein